jgi:cytoskeleton protein RodZ
MSEPTEAAAPSGTAGSMLRTAREKQGLHIAALAATIKITQNKLEALEQDRYEDLPDATFTRALAMTVCRALKIDPAPVLAQLPQLGSRTLAQAKGGLNAPYRERTARGEPTEVALSRRPLVWAALLVLLAAAVIFLVPQSWWQSLSSTAETAGAAVERPAAVLPMPASVAANEVAVAAEPPASSASQAAQVEIVHSVPVEAAAASAPADGAQGVALLRVKSSSWVEVRDARGQVLVSRTLQPGEMVGLSGSLPFKLKIGNAAATELFLRGQPVDLSEWTRDNVARLEVK